MRLRQRQLVCQKAQPRARGPLRLRRTWALLASALGTVVLVPVLATPAAAASVTFSYTGSVQHYTVPTGVTALAVDVAGGAGGASGNIGGPGGRLQATMVVTPGQVLDIYAGGQGAHWNGGAGGAGGWNGGGAGGSFTGTPGAWNGGTGGGGASDIRSSGGGLSNRLVVAGGGGGDASTSAVGGPGGGPVGQPGIYGGGGGGTQSAAGAPGGGNATAGSFGSGGTGASTAGYPGGGGAGGWYGGGGGGDGGGSGGGGSGYSGNAINPVWTVGYELGNGYVTLTPIGGLVQQVLNPGYPSSTCQANGGQRVIDTTTEGIHAFVYTYQPSLQELDVCVRAEDTSLGLGFGGKAAITPTVPTVSGGGVGVPSVDGNASACSTTPGNKVPGTHPITSGAVDGVSYSFDAFTDGASTAWVCVTIGSINDRVVVPVSVSLPSVNLGFDVTWYPDPGTA